MFSGYVIAAIAAAILAGPQPARASVRDSLPSGGYSWIVILDARETPQLQTRVASMSRADFVRCTDGASSLEDIIKAIVGSEERPGCPTVRSRWLSQRGDTVRAVGISDAGTTPRLAFEEVARTSRIATDLETLMALGMKIGGVKVASVSPPPVVITEIHVLAKTRATLAVSLSVAKGDSAVGAADAAKPAVKTSLVTGPVERLFLSTNVGVTSAKQVSYSQESKTLAPAEAPKQFYVSANLSASDLYADRADNPGLRMLQSTYAGFFVEGSTKPLNQIGAIVGLRYLPLLSDVIGIDKVSPYGGILWLHDDALVDQTATNPGTVKAHYGSPKFVYGLSLNLSEALGWVGGDSKKK